MRPHQSLALLAWIISSLPTAALAQRGDSLPILSLEPMIAAIFSICVIFAVFTLLQAIYALYNLYRQRANQPPSISTPEFSVGPIFPWFLLLSTLLLATGYALHGAYHAVKFNQNAIGTPTISVEYHSAWLMMGFLADILLLSALLALISHREKVLLNSSGPWFTLKKAVDAVFMMVLLALAIAVVCLRSLGETGVHAETLFNVVVAYVSIFLVVVLNIAISSTVLHFRTKQSPINDHKIVRCIATTISPLFTIYALHSVLKEVLPKYGVMATRAQWDLAGLTVDCVIEFLIIAMCLKFGMPPITKPAGQAEKEVRAVTPPHKVYQEEEA